MVRVIGQMFGVIRQEARIAIMYMCAAHVSVCVVEHWKPVSV